MLPSVAEWFVDAATPQDGFFMALSGWGYCHPYRAIMSKTPDPAAAWEVFLNTTLRYVRDLGLTHLGLYTDAWGAVSAGGAGRGDAALCRGHSRAAGTDFGDGPG